MRPVTCWHAAWTLAGVEHLCKQSGTTLDHALIAPSDLYPKGLGGESEGGGGNLLLPYVHCIVCPAQEGGHRKLRLMSQDSTHTTPFTGYMLFSHCAADCVAEDGTRERWMSPETAGEQLNLSLIADTTCYTYS